MRFWSRLALLAVLGVTLACAANNRRSNPIDPPSAVTSTVEVPGGRVHAWKVGSGTGTPLIVIHGGPGFPHDYLQNLGELGSDRIVVFWDQLGCGQSERPTDASLWRIERFVDELEGVHAATLGADKKVMLLGGCTGVIRSTPGGDSPNLQQHEAAGTTDSDAYNAAYGQFIARHLLRVDPFPEPVMRALKGKGHQVYETMWGPSEFTFTGNLNTYERTDQIAGLGKPTLYVVGEHDEVVPTAARAYAAATPGSEVIVIEDASHLKNLEQPSRYLKVVRAFLSRQDR